MLANKNTLCIRVIIWVSRCLYKSFITVFVCTSQQFLDLIPYVLPRHICENFLKTVTTANEESVFIWVIICVSIRTLSITVFYTSFRGRMMRVFDFPSYLFLWLFPDMMIYKHFPSFDPYVFVHVYVWKDVRNRYGSKWENSYYMRYYMCFWQILSQFLWQFRWSSDDSFHLSVISVFIVVSRCDDRCVQNTYDGKVNTVSIRPRKLSYNSYENIPKLIGWYI